MVCPFRLASNTIVSPLCASSIRSRSEPSPKLPVLVTVSVLSRSRVSRPSHRGRKERHGRGPDLRAFVRLLWFPRVGLVRSQSQESSVMVRFSFCCISGVKDRGSPICITANTAQLFHGEVSAEDWAADRNLLGGGPEAQLIGRIASATAVVRDQEVIVRALEAGFVVEHDRSADDR